MKLNLHHHPLSLKEVVENPFAEESPVPKKIPSPETFPTKIVQRKQGGSVLTVNARDIHSFLEIGRDFSSWIKDQVERARLVEFRDFVISTQKGEYRKPLTEYHLTMDAAKHICMLSQTDQGFVVREYFIDCEEKAKKPEISLDDPATVRMLLLNYTEKVIALEEEKKILQPKALIADKITASEGELSFRAVAKILGVKENTLRLHLRQNGWVYYLGKRMTAYSTMIAKGYMDENVVTIERDGDSDKLIRNCYFTPKGLTALCKAFGVEKKEYDNDENS